MRKQGIQFNCKNSRRNLTNGVSLNEHKYHTKHFSYKVKQNTEPTSNVSQSTNSSYKSRVCRSASSQKHVPRRCRLSRGQRPYSSNKSSSAFNPVKSIFSSFPDKYASSSSSPNRNRHSTTSRIINDFSDGEKSDTSYPLFLKILRKKKHRIRVNSIEAKHYESERSSCRGTSQKSFPPTSVSSKTTFSVDKTSKNLSFEPFSSRKRISTSSRSKKLSIKRNFSKSLSYESKVSRQKYWDRRCIESPTKKKLYRTDFSKESCSRKSFSQRKDNEGGLFGRKHCKTMDLTSLSIDCSPYKRDTLVDQRYREKIIVKPPVKKSQGFMKNLTGKNGKKNNFSVSLEEEKTSTLYSDNCHTQSQNTPKDTSRLHFNDAGRESVTQPSLVYKKTADYQSNESNRNNSLPYKASDKTVTQTFQNDKQYDANKRTNAQDCQEHRQKEIHPSSCEENVNTSDIRSFPFQRRHPLIAPYSYCHQPNSCDESQLEKLLFQRPPPIGSCTPSNFHGAKIEPHIVYPSGNKVLRKPQNVAFHSNFSVSSTYYNSPRPPIYQNSQPLIRNFSAPFFCETVVANNQFCVPPKLNELSNGKAVNTFSLEEGEINENESKILPLSTNNILAPYQYVNSSIQVQSKMLQHSEVIHSTFFPNENEKPKTTQIEIKKKADYYVYNEEAWTIDCVTLVPKVLKQLAPGGLLDDTALEFFFRFLHRFVIKKSERNLFFFFNSYFYTKLMDGGTTARTRHEAVKRWTNRLLCHTKPLTNESSTGEKLKKLLNKNHTDIKFHNKSVNENKNQDLKLFIWDFDIVCIPLHDSAHHWTLMLVCYPYAALRSPIESMTALDENITRTSKDDVHTVEVINLKNVIEEKNSKTTEDTSACGLQSFDVENMPNYSFLEVSLKEKIDSGFFLSCPQKAAIFHLDSLEYTFSSPTNIKENIVEYFQQEFRSRFPFLYKQGYHFADSKEWFFNPHISVPCQKNNYDCGVFLIEYLRYLLTDMQRIQHLLYSSPTTQISSITSIKEAPSQPNVSSWFPATQVSHRRRCLRKILLLMQKYPNWKTSNETLEWNGVCQTPLDMMVKLFSSTDPQDLKASTLLETCERIKCSTDPSLVGD